MENSLETYLSYRFTKQQLESNAFSRSRVVTEGKTTKNASVDQSTGEMVIQKYITHYQKKHNEAGKHQYQKEKNESLSLSSNDHLLWGNQMKDFQHHRPTEEDLGLKQQIKHCCDVIKTKDELIQSILREQNQLREKVNTIEKLSDKEVQRLSSQIQTKGHELRKMQRLLDGGRTELEGLKTQIRLLVKDAELFKRSICDLVGEKERIQDECEGLRSQFRTEQISKDESVRRQADLERAYGQKAAALNERITEQQSQIDSYKRYVEKLEGDKRTMHANYLYERSQRWSDVTSLQRRQDDELKKINAELRNALGEMKECRLMAKCYVDLLDQKENEIIEVKRWK